MRSNPRLGLVNFALVSAYFVPVWGHEALRVLTSPFNGFEDRAHAVAAAYYRDVFDFGLTGLIRTSELLAGIKMVIVAAFVAYLIEFARALVTRREPNRETVDVVLGLALAGAFIWILPTLKLGDPDLIRLQATQFLLLIGAAVVIMIDRHIEHGAQMRAAAGSAVARAPETAALAGAPCGRARHDAVDRGLARHPAVPLHAALVTPPPVHAAPLHAALVTPPPVHAALP
jgi:hypothetical protein